MVYIIHTYICIYTSRGRKACFRGDMTVGARERVKQTTGYKR